MAPRSCPSSDLLATSTCYYAVSIRKSQMYQLPVSRKGKSDVPMASDTRVPEQCTRTSRPPLRFRYGMVIMRRVETQGYRHTNTVRATLTTRSSNAAAECARIDVASVLVRFAIRSVETRFRTVQGSRVPNESNRSSHIELRAFSLLAETRAYTSLSRDERRGGDASKQSETKR